MKKDGYYSSGTFAKMAGVTKKTLRYYDAHHILKPSYTAENGNKYYSDNDFARLQQIIYLKYLSFPLEDIKELTVRTADRDFWIESLNMQTGLIDGQIEQLNLMKESLNGAKEAVEAGREVNWSEMLRLANANELEQKLKRQYQTTANISARIDLHEMYAENPEGWFPWIFRMAGFRTGERILELGCGDGALWTRNADRIPEGIDLTLTDISDGIARETEKRIREAGISASVRVMDAEEIRAEDASFDTVIANHMLFYCADLQETLSGIRRVLKPGGRLIAGTYSGRHMREISGLVKEFDSRITLSKNELYTVFGKENGKEILGEFFREVSWEQYEDALTVTRPEPLIAYIMSCHGNQNRYIVDRYHEFSGFVKRKTDAGFRVTKDAGVFIGIK